ncbi:MAG: methyltransferase domain-containing protein [Chloroflexota bacterium]
MTATPHQIVEKAKQGFKDDLFAQDYNPIHLDDDHLATVLSLCQLLPDKQYLDLGTGNGYVAFAIAAQNSQSLITGIDIVPQAVDANNERAKTEAYKNVAFQAYEGLTLPFDGEQFFGVVSRYVFHHFPNPALMAQQISKILQLDGFCVIADPTPHQQDETDFINQFAGLKDDGHVRFYTGDRLEEIFEETGLRIEKQVATSLTFPRTMNEAYAQLIAQTPRTILDAYQLRIEDDLVYVTVEILNTCFR